MRRLIFALFLSLCTVGYSQNLWSKTKLMYNPISEQTEYDYCYEYSNDRTTAHIHISPIFGESIAIESSNPFGRFHYSFFTRNIICRVTVKFYDQFGTKINRFRESVNLGKTRTNLARTFGVLKNKDIREYLLKSKGYIVVSYSSLLDNSDVDIVIPCIDNTSEE